jgi:hypothetical protein
MDSAAEGGEGSQVLLEFRTEFRTPRALENNATHYFRGKNAY